MAAGMIGERWRWVTIAFLTVCLLIGMAREAMADDTLAEFEALAGTFEQQIHDSNGQLLSTSRGDFALLKPHFLRWQVAAPGQQWLISDGQYLWQYDLDLETVTRQPMDAGQHSPLRLLIEPESVLVSDYTIEHDTNRMTLTPKAQDPLFQSVTITLVNARPVAMQLIDNLGQIIDVAFELAESVSLTPDDFHFEPPPGVDVTLAEG